MRFVKRNSATKVVPGCLGEFSLAIGHFPLINKHTNAVQWTISIYRIEKVYPAYKNITNDQLSSIL